MRETSDLEIEVKSEYSDRLIEKVTKGRYGLVLGATSSGKSTAIRSLIERCPDLFRAYDEALLQLPRFARYFDRLFARQDASAYLPFEIEALLIRHLQNDRLNEFAIADQGIHSIWAYARAVHAGGGMDDDAYQTVYATYLFLRSNMSLPKFVIHFRCDAAVSRKRLEQRGREHELSAYSEEFLKRLDEAYVIACQDFPDDIPINVIDTTYLAQAEVLHELEQLTNALSKL